MGNKPLTPSNAAVYSTSNWVPTGETWIDGKPIYRRCFTGSTAAGVFPQAIPETSNIAKIISYGGFASMPGSITLPFCYAFVYTQEQGSASLFLNHGVGISVRVMQSNQPAASSYEFWIEVTLNS